MFSVRDMLVRLFAVLLLGLIGLAFLFPAATAQKHKLTVEELLEKHLASIGSPEQLAELKSLAATGLGQFRALTGPDWGYLEGTATFGSQGAKVKSEIQFGVSNFPRDSVSYDGSKISVSQIRPGIRSEIGDFLYVHGMILKEGLFGGVFSTAWPLYHLKSKRRLRYQGLKDNLHQVSFRQRSGDFGVEIHLYFEQETFRHLASTFRLSKNLSYESFLRGGGREDSTLEERFGNHREVNGLTLPHSWTVRLSNRGLSRNSVSEWQMEFTDWELNPQLPQDFFKIH